MVMATQRPSSPSGKIFAEQQKNALSASLQDTALLESPVGDDGDSEPDETDEALKGLDESGGALEGLDETEEALQGAGMDDADEADEALEGMDEDTVQH